MSKKTEEILKGKAGGDKGICFSGDPERVMTDPGDMASSPTYVLKCKCGEKFKSMLEFNIHLHRQG